MKKFKYILLPVVAILFVISCDEDGYADYDADGKPSLTMNGEWFINISDETGTVQVANALHRTYDDNNGGLWISDRFDATQFYGWYLESVVQYDLQNLTFSGSNLTNFADDSKVTITEGKIIKNGAHTESGVVVDSIYFKGVFDYDPETVLIFSGRKRTGFEEDEH
ncbi:lipid-binding protein [Flavobacterium psychrotrophum]|uniref:lipid-binding protein n=1 Tax=Flavobacterium psychrotrophum TaxID=2294119 RepID=UPI001F09F2AB|nr:lipid-binding protein [Flavobacterium psychrotrophum]